MGNRKLTIFGEKEIITLLIPQVHNNATILPNPPENIVKQINRLILNFVWNTKDRLKRNPLYWKIKFRGIIDV